MKDRARIKLTLKLWFMWTLVSISFTIFGMTQTEKGCVNRECECGALVLTWLIFYNLGMISLLFSQFIQYRVLFTMFASRRNNKLFERRRILVHYPFLILLGGFGFFFLYASHRRKKNHETCQSKKFMKYWHYAVWYVLFISVLAVFFLLKLVKFSLISLVKKCKPRPDYLSSDEVDNENFDRQEISLHR